MASFDGGGGRQGQGAPTGDGVVPANRPLFNIEGRIVEPPTPTAAQLDMIRGAQYPRGVFVPSDEYEAAGAARAAKRAKQTDTSGANEKDAKTTTAPKK